MIQASPDKRVDLFLMASYRYYLCYESIMPDRDYDMLCRDLLTDWDAIESPHKHLITREMLESGTGYNLRAEDYPQEIIDKSAGGRSDTD